MKHIFNPYLLHKAQSYLYDHGLWATIKKIIRMDYKNETHHIDVTTTKQLTHAQFIKADTLTPLEANLWIFPVCAYEHTLTGNDRALFEAIKNNPTIKKVILTRSKIIKLDGINVQQMPLQSHEAQQTLLKAPIIFIKHTPRVNVLYPLNAKKHKFINLWHGIPLKRIGIASLDLKKDKKVITTEQAKFYKIIASSAVDRMAMASAFYPLTYNDIWVTGLPRHDLILQHQDTLPEDFQIEIKRLESLLSSKKFILFAPTFRNSQKNGYYSFSLHEKEALYNYLSDNNIILGIREHMADTEHTYTHTLQHPSIIYVQAESFPNIEVLYRRADLLITDYSSCFIDFMITGKPMISFAYDYLHYTKEERGLFYDLELAFAGKICQNFEDLLKELKLFISQEVYTSDETYGFKQRLFFDYIDTHNSDRLITKLLELKH